MACWADFSGAAPELAALGEERFARFGIVFVGTVRRDGGPRVNPVEVYVVDGELALNMMRGSLKALDLLRDPRIFVHTVVTSRAATDGEFKVVGRARDTDDAGLRARIADRMETEIQWRPPPDSHFFVVDVERAAFVEWANGEKRMQRWRADRGVY